MPGVRDVLVRCKMRRLYLELVDDSPDAGVACTSVRKEVSDTAIKQCLYGKPFDLLAEINDLAEELNRKTAERGEQ